MVDSKTVFFLKNNFYTFSAVLFVICSGDEDWSRACVDNPIIGIRVGWSVSSWSNLVGFIAGLPSSVEFLGFPCMAGIQGKVTSGLVFH